MNGLACIETGPYMYVAHIACYSHMTDINFILWYWNHQFQIYHRTNMKYDSNSSSLIDSWTILWSNLNYHRLNCSKWLNQLPTPNDRVDINFQWSSSIIPWYSSKLLIYLDLFYIRGRSGGIQTRILSWLSNRHINNKKELDHDYKLI